MFEHSLYVEGQHYIPSSFAQIKQYIMKANVFIFRGEWHIWRLRSFKL